MSTDAAKAPIAAKSSSPDMIWWGWGTAEHHQPLSAGAAAMLTGALGIDRPPEPPGRRPDPAPSRLEDSALQQLVTIVGRANVRTDDATRVAHCRGKSTVDLLRIRGGDAVDAPDAVVLPAAHHEVLAILKCCTDSHLAVVPFGGGTSVVGGLAPETGSFAATVALDLRRMAGLVAVDRISMTATLQPGLRGPEVEALLADEGLTLGHFPQSFEHASIGGFAATRSSGQASAGYGRFDAMVVGLTLATPVGSWTLGRSPANAAGPDLRQVVLGSEGAFGVITELTVAVRAAPVSRNFAGWQVPNFATGIDLLRSLAQADALPTVARLSDETETAVGLANATRTGEQTAKGCYLLVGFEGSSVQVSERSALTAAHLAAGGAKELNADVGETWLQGRFHAPYLRDALLDIGGLVETVETATWWSNIPALYAAVRAAATSALADTPPMVLCHISHLYRTGASLYFTVICKQAAEPVAQWAAAKHAISDAVMAAGGSITHHHAIGTDHRPWLQQEIGDIGVRVLGAIKREIDPAGILNPGVLVER